MEFKIGERVFYTRTGEYGAVIEIDHNFERPIVAQRDGSDWDMCYYKNGWLYDHDECPSIIKVEGNEKEIEKFKIRIKINKLNDTIVEIERLIEKIKKIECSLVIESLENTKSITNKEINKLLKEC